MSGYKDSMYWASDDEIVAHRERQQKASEAGSKPEPVYISHTEHYEGERVFVDVQACKPVKIDGFDI